MFIKMQLDFLPAKKTPHATGRPSPIFFYNQPPSFDIMLLACRNRSLRRKPTIWNGLLIAALLSPGTLRWDRMLVSAEGGTMKVDVHAHCYPKPYMDEIQKLGVGGEGGVGVKVPVWENAEERIAQMDGFGVDVQVLNLSAPNVYFPDEGLSNALARMTNDFLANIAKQHPERFLSVASIPLTNLRPCHGRAIESHR